MPSFRPGSRSPLLWLFFSLPGRISRGVYWLAYFLIVALNSVVVGQIVGGEAASYHRLAQSAFPFVVPITLYCNFALGAKRLHDVGYSGFLAVALFIPLVNFAFTIWVGLLPGNAGPNRYGDAADRVPR